MREMILSMALVIWSCISVAATPVLAKGATSSTDRATEAPKATAKGESELVLDQWNYIGGKLIVMAEDFPENEYEFKPTPAQRSFAEQLIHAAGALYYFTDAVDGKKPRYLHDPARDELKTKAQIVAFVEKCVEDGRAAIKVKGDKGILDIVGGVDNQLVPAYDLAYRLIEHSAEHYGELVTYYHVAGLVPPEYRPKK